MRKIFALLCFGATALFGVSCHSAEQKNNGKATDSALTRVAVPLSDTLAAKMSLVLDTYYQLKDAFVADDSVTADSMAKMLANNIGPLSLKELQSDSKRYDKGRAALESLDGELSGLLGETTMLGKRKEFQMVSDIMYDLITSVGLKEKTVYRDFCPMFNDGKGAFWLSANKRINNPYYGEDMLGCGEIKETIQF
jgi:hypothetical protein